MKKWLVFLFLLSFVSASVNVDNYSVGSVYLPFDKIKGSVSLDIVDEDYNEMIVLSNGSGIVLGDFLRYSGIDFSCSPFDCLMGYTFLSPEISKVTALQSSQEKYIGFVLTGADIVLNNIDFKISSDFSKGSQLPLFVEFFEDEQWKFDDFSDDFLNKNWGCFDSSSKRVGPLIGNSFYCEMISIENSGKLRVGADVMGGQGELNMAVYPMDGFESWGCSFDPNVEDGCVITPDMGEIINGGDYKVCVGAETLTSYNIYEENVDVNCGFPYDAGLVSSVKDYGIFVQGVKYADAGSVLDLTLTEEHIDSANAFIEERYGGDCSEGCVLPLRISGVAQNFNVYDVVLDYTDNYEWRSSNLVYNLETSPAKIDFSGVLDLNLLSIVVSKAGEYFATLLGQDLFREDVTLFAVPIISSVSPLNPSVGVFVSFYADIDFEGNATLSYEWSFGDGESAQSDVPSVMHMYDDLDNYTLSLRVIPGDNLTLSSISNFSVETISPEAAVVAGLLSKKTSLTNVRAKVEGFSTWYVNDLLEILNIGNLEKELSGLEKAQNDSFNIQALVLIMNSVYSLDVPIDVWGSNFESSFLIPDAQGINIDPVVAISGVSGSGINRDYVSPILAWQEENVDVSMKLKNVFGLYLQGKNVGILSAYSFDIVSRGRGESYFVIDVPLSELHFNRDVGAKEAGDSTVIVLNEGEKKLIEFYYEGVESASFFVSPKLSSFVIESDITGACNFNKVCEGSLGENSDTCRNDCKPVGKAIWFFVIGFIGFLFVYTMLQIWYKRHYEAYLFKDNVQMYNLLMYVTNARNRGIKDSKISAELKSKGWSSERVNYVIRKSAGKSIGMIEIIPIEFISAWLRKRKAKKTMGTTTSTVQQNNTNINK
jgi:hypothetical protein